MRARRLLLWFAFVPLAGTVCAEKVEVLRDGFGVPHIFARTAAGAAYASGYVQAEDRLEELLRNYRRAAGTMSEAFGDAFLEHDYRQRLWRHSEVAENAYVQLAAPLRALAEAYIAGVERYMHEHPREVPAWAPRLEPWFVPMLARYMIWGWMEREVGGELLRAGIRPDPAAYRGSNEWLLAGSRTASGAPIALIDPHLSWYGEFRFYEMRVYAGEMALSGAAVVGIPFPSAGHSRWISVAMTTGGPDTSDVFEEEVAGGKYRFRDQWRPLETRRERIAVKTASGIVSKEYTIESTHHGPIVAHKNGKAYAAAIPYATESGPLEANWRLLQARNLTEAKAALATFQFMPQNIMIGTVDGDIFYVRNGRVPVRPAGCDAGRPMPGSGACEWQGLHPFADLVQIANPPAGYMQNCNASPEWLYRGSPLTPDKYAAHPYLFNLPAGPPHQRAAAVIELLEAARNVTPERAIEMAFSTEVHGARSWQERIAKDAPADSAFARLLTGWNRRTDADSRGALAFYLFKLELGAAARATEPPGSLTGEQVRAALRKAGERLEREFGADAVFGTYFRVGREGSARTYPAAGGTLPEAGMNTPRAISFGKRGREMVGRGGQTATQIVVLTRPPQSYMVIPLGESDHADSTRFDDQAEKLFSRSRMKSTYFLNRRELEKHIERVERLDWQASHARKKAGLPAGELAPQ
jgi:acyl-homoserine lactone acylase PvdQ